MIWKPSNFPVGFSCCSICWFLLSSGCRVSVGGGRFRSCLLFRLVCFCFVLPVYFVVPGSFSAELTVSLI